MLFQCTKKLLDKLDIGSLSVNNDVKDIYSWHANLLNIKGKDGIVFVNDETKYSLICLNLTDFDFKNIEKLFFEGLKKLLEEECIDVPSNAYFYNIHNVIVESFGWEDDHLHEFYINEIENPEIIVSNDKVLFREGYDDKIKNELKAKLIYFLKVKDTFDYLYDFGYNWLHKIEIIDIVKEYNKNYSVCIMAEGWIKNEVDIKLINSNLKYYYW